MSWNVHIWTIWTRRSTRHRPVTRVWTQFHTQGHLSCRILTSSSSLVEECDCICCWLCTCCVHWGGVTLERGVKPVWTPWGNMGSNIGSNTHWTTHKSQTTLNGLNVRRTKEMVPNVGGRPPLGTANLTQGGEHGKANEFLFQYFLHSCHSGRNCTHLELHLHWSMRRAVWSDFQRFLKIFIGVSKRQCVYRTGSRPIEFNC